MIKVLFCLFLLLPSALLADVTTISHADDAAYAKDAYVSSYTSVNDNFGISGTLIAESRAGLGSKYSNMLLWFDHTVYTGGADAINACTLWVKAQSASAESGSATNVMVLGAITAANYWAEGPMNGGCPTDTGCNYGHRRCRDIDGPCGCTDGADDSWAGSGGCSTPGTDYQTADSVSLDVSAVGASDWVGFDITDMFTAWTAGTYNNEGIVMKNNYAATTGNEAIFKIFSTETTGSEWYVEVTWSTTSGQVIIIE